MEQSTKVQMVLDPSKLKPHKEKAYFLIQLSAVEAHNKTLSEMSEEMTEIIKEFEEIFALPQQLPPQRNHDHHIPLQPDSKPVNSFPYRCPLAHREEIKKLTREMLDARIIRASTSPFSLLVLLVRKKYHTWRLVIDYRALNSITVKNKFPIPVIEELLSELKGNRVYTKLDLRSGYHQIRLCKDDIYKTAFRTHQGHFEFLVMPFGLTNAPASFQALMNEVFSDFLGKFVLVFFDDILIYSSSLDEHLTHLRLVFEKLQANNLFVKKGKYEFAQPQIEYLGHVIFSAWSCCC